MTSDKFIGHMRILLQNIESLFATKNEQYSTDNEVFSNFIDGANFLNKSSEQTLLYFMTKHLIYVKGTIEDNSIYSDVHKFRESLMDIIVYFIILFIMTQETD